MVNILLAQCISSGFPGAPGYTTFAFLHGEGATEDEQFQSVLNFWEAIKGSFPGGWSVQLASEHRIVDESSGELIDMTSATVAGSGSPISGTSSSGYGAGVAGAVLSWRTATNNRGRRIRGRTFLVPMRAAAYDSDGTLVSGLAAGMSGDASSAMVVPANDFVIWSRPRAGTGGKAGIVTSVAMPDRVSYLRSRRD